MQLRYGMNPHQKRAEIIDSPLPFEVLNGEPGYINILDALNSWQLVRELKAATGQAAASSFKHVNPAGAAIGRALPENLKKAYFAHGLDTSPLARAYLRARGCDRIVIDACNEYNMVMLFTGVRLFHH